MYKVEVNSDLLSTVWLTRRIKSVLSRGSIWFIEQVSQSKCGFIVVLPAVQVVYLTFLPFFNSLIVNRNLLLHHSLWCLKDPPLLHLFSQSEGLDNTPTPPFLLLFKTQYLHA